jgi:hypothetical protein
VFWRGDGDALYSTIGTLATSSAVPLMSWSAPSQVAGTAGLESQPAATYVAAGTAAGVWVFWRGRHATLWATRARPVGPARLDWPNEPQIVPNTG